ncbi:hypothetical protein QBC47DRAFT_38320 [Echria macrotheca]|uniref:Uncharacterized protein n=1 Tax=Echria macrotheca TaxID=438768 RepID=A0AAJ0FAG6_9PEZI|nr:hypothetical protein QBC47DRAFT_38320 [Echria macrotheca]
MWERRGVAWRLHGTLYQEERSSLSPVSICSQFTPLIRPQKPPSNVLHRYGSGDGSFSVDSPGRTAPYPNSPRFRKPTVVPPSPGSRIRASVKDSAFNTPARDLSTYSPRHLLVLQPFIHDLQIKIQPAVVVVSTSPLVHVFTVWHHLHLVVQPIVAQTRSNCPSSLWILGTSHTQPSSLLSHSTATSYAHSHCLALHDLGSSSMPGTFICGCYCDCKRQIDVPNSEFCQRCLNRCQKE